MTQNKTSIDIKALSHILEEIVHEHQEFGVITMSELGVDPFSYGPFGFIFLSAIFFLAAYAVAWTIRKFTGSNIV